MKFTLIIASILAISAGNVFAQSTSGSQSQAGASVFNQSTTGAFAQSGGGSVVQTYNTSGKQEIENSGTSTIRNNPAISAPGVVTANQCSGGISGGASGNAFGLTLGGTVSESWCIILQQANALNVVAGRQAALVHLARDPDICKTLRTTGQISSQSLCTDEERRAAKRAKPVARPASVSGSSAPAKARAANNPLDDLTICKKTGARKAKVEYKNGLAAAKRPVAKAACLASLGF